MVAYMNKQHVFQVQDRTFVLILFRSGKSWRSIERIVSAKENM